MRVPTQSRPLNLCCSARRLVIYPTAAFSSYSCTLGLCVQNVFIAVLIETFAEIRVQFQQMWAPPRTAALEDSVKVCALLHYSSTLHAILVNVKALSQRAALLSHLREWESRMRGILSTGK